VYSVYEEYSQYYVYNFDSVGGSDKTLIGIRIKDCGHGFNPTKDEYQGNFFRIFSDERYALALYDGDISRDVDTKFCG